MPPAMPDPSSRRLVLAGLLLCFFFSGAAGLIYQVAWSKALGLIFGHTAYAVATVLAVFMGGLATGSAWLGRWSEHRERPIALYGWIELGVAATGAVSLAGLAAVRVVYVAAYPYASEYGPTLLAMRFVGAAIVLFLPTFLMGGTLPVLVRGLTRNSAQLGTRLARLYWVNTAGAVVGTFAAGFLFLPTLGLRQTVGVAVALNLVAGVLALRLSRHEAIAMQAASAVAQKTNLAPSIRPSQILCFCFGIVGATAMAYEIGWTRLLATQLGSSTYAFTLMLATFLAGIVLGSAIFEKWNRRHEVSQMTFAVTQTFTALAAMAFLIAKAQSAAISGAGTRENAVGRAYAWNTLGAIAGAVATGFWLLPRLGSFHLLAATAAANLLLAAVLSITSIPRRVIYFAGNVALL